jgi:hypothetical protein
MDHDAVRRVLAALEREKVQYVVFGAVAVNLLVVPRATEYLDIFVAPDPGNIERLEAALRSVFADPSIEEITAEDLLGEHPAVQYVPPSSRTVHDLAPTDVGAVNAALAPAGVHVGSFERRSVRSPTRTGGASRKRRGWTGPARLPRLSAAAPATSGGPGPARR